MEYDAALLREVVRKYVQDSDHQTEAPVAEGDLAQHKPLVNQRHDRASSPRGNAPRPPQESRRKRGGDHRGTGWGDQLLHSICIHALHELPPAFPVEHHLSTATIPRAIVARRDDEVLFCTYSHCGPHAWPDGEVVSEG